jgi:hypothetical protein
MADQPRRIKSDNAPRDAGFSEHVIWEKPDGTLYEKKPRAEGWTPYTEPAAVKAPAPERKVAEGANVNLQGGRQEWNQEGNELREQRRGEEAAAKAKATEKYAPWLLHDSKSKLSLGDASTVQRMMRDDNITKEEAEKKLKWMRDTGGTTTKDAAKAMSR